jgi:hypothetical protein
LLSLTQFWHRAPSFSGGNELIPMLANRIAFWRLVRNIPFFARVRLSMPVPNAQPLASLFCLSEQFVQCNHRY